MVCKWVWSLSLNITWLHRVPLLVKWSYTKQQTKCKKTLCLDCQSNRKQRLLFKIPGNLMKHVCYWRKSNVEDDFHLSHFCPLFLAMAWMGTTCFSLVFVSIYFRNDRKRSLNSFFITVFKHAAFSCAKIQSVTLSIKCWIPTCFINFIIMGL